MDLITYPHHSRDPLAAYRPIACHGAYVFDRKGKAVHRTLAAVTILATGGIGRIYRNTTNPPGRAATGWRWHPAPGRASSTPNTSSSIPLRWRCRGRRVPDQ